MPERSRKPAASEATLGVLPGELDRDSGQGRERSGVEVAVVGDPDELAPADRTLEEGDERRLVDAQSRRQLGHHRRPRGPGPDLLGERAPQPGIFSAQHRNVVRAAHRRPVADDAAFPDQGPQRRQGEASRGVLCDLPAQRAFVRTDLIGVIGMPSRERAAQGIANVVPAPPGQTHAMPAAADLDHLAGTEERMRPRRLQVAGERELFEVQAVGRARERFAKGVRVLRGGERPQRGEACGPRPAPGRREGVDDLPSADGAPARLIPNDEAVAGGGVGRPVEVNLREAAASRGQVPRFEQRDAGPGESGTEVQVHRRPVTEGTALAGEDAQANVEAPGDEVEPFGHQPVAATQLFAAQGRAAQVDGEALSRPAAGRVPVSGPAIPAPAQRARGAARAADRLPPPGPRRRRR